MGELFLHGRDHVLSYIVLEIILLKCVRSSRAQFRPMGEMFSMPVRNSMNVPHFIGTRDFGVREDPVDQFL